MLLSTALVAMALALPPDVPFDLQIIQEEGRFVIRTLDPAKPVYTFDKDQPGKSNCVDACAAAWPPVLVKNGKPTAKWTIVARADGAKQWAFEGKPVYTFARDPEGKATGDGMGGAWHLLPSYPAK